MVTEIRLTDDAEYLLCILYDAYRLRRKNGRLSSDSRIFGGSEYIQENYIPQWPTDDIEDVARELSRNGLVKCLFADNLVYELILEREGIALMEHRFGDKLDKLTQRITSLASMLFG